MTMDRRTLLKVAALAPIGALQIDLEELSPDKKYLAVAHLSRPEENTDLVERHIKSAFVEAGVPWSNVGVIVLQPDASIDIYEVA